METLQSFTIRRRPYAYNTAGESIPTFIKEKTRSSSIVSDVRNNNNNNNMNVFFRPENMRSLVGCMCSV